VENSFIQHSISTYSTSRTL